jgi:hypothetical protein
MVKNNACFANKMQGSTGWPGLKCSSCQGWQHYEKMYRSTFFSERPPAKAGSIDHPADLPPSPTGRGLGRAKRGVGDKIKKQFFFIHIPSSWPSRKLLHALHYLLHIWTHSGLQDN